MSCIRQTGAVIVSWYLHQAFRKYNFFQSFELQCNNMSTITTFWWRETNVIWIVFPFFFCVRGSVNYLWLHFKVKTCCTIFLSPTTLQRCPISHLFSSLTKSQANEVWFTEEELCNAFEVLRCSCLSVAVDFENWKTLWRSADSTFLDTADTAQFNCIRKSIWNKSTDYVQACLGLGVFVLYSSELGRQNCKIDNELSVSPLVKLNGHVNSVWNAEY